MPDNDLLYRLALSRVPGIGPVYAKKLLGRFGDAKAIFQANETALADLSGVGQIRAKAIARFDNWAGMESELAFMERYSIRSLFFTDQDYPQRLLHCKDAPILLFYKGKAELNAPRILSVVGTRTPSEYGKQAIARLIRDLEVCGPLIISGLAFGIDVAAHKAALDHSLPTVAVLAHGLDRLYPPQHKHVAAEMIKHQGGLLTNFGMDTEPASYNFVLRNRIVAGMSDAVIVMETDTNGGSMLTAKKAFAYKKKIFAVPGRISDKTSRGCNQLIQQRRAQMLLNASQLITEMGWDSSANETMQQGSLFPTEEPKGLSENEKTVFSLLREKEKLSIDELSRQTKLNSSAVAMALLKLELQGIVLALPGKQYRLAA
ncbi:MAG TPA: DNA-processing protein DprA [Puia sp.]|nr:DNA-processing protein DprA [Puia sp.]